MVLTFVLNGGKYKGSNDLVKDEEKEDEENKTSKKQRMHVHQNDHDPEQLSPPQEINESLLFFLYSYVSQN